MSSKSLHSRTYRDKYDMIAEILYLCLHRDRTITQIIDNVGIHHARLSRILRSMQNKGLLELQSSPPLYVYATTEKGKEFVMRYKKMVGLVKSDKAYELTGRHTDATAGSEKVTRADVLLQLENAKNVLLTELASKLGLSTYATGYHLQILSKEGYALRVRRGQYAITQKGIDLVQSKSRDRMSIQVSLMKEWYTSEAGSPEKGEESKGPRRGFYGRLAEAIQTISRGKNTLSAVIKDVKIAHRYAKALLAMMQQNGLIKPDSERTGFVVTWKGYLFIDRYLDLSELLF